MIDPVHMTEYGASDERLQEIVLFCVLVAGNNAKTTAKGLDKFLRLLKSHFAGFHPADFYTPFRMIRAKFNNNIYDRLETSLWLQSCGIGKHTRKGRSIVELAYSGLNLKTCTIDDLEKIHGIGLKTSRFFILHTRPDSRVASLDTHILKFLRDNGIDAPKSTPSSKKKYLELEKKFLEIADKSGMRLSDFDLMLWNKYSGNKVKI